MKHLIPIATSGVVFDQLALFENYRKWIDPLVASIKKPDHLSPRGVLLTPAEMEAVVRQTHTGKNKAPKEKQILAEIVRRKPCAASMDENLAQLRHWACRYAEWIWTP